MFEEISFMKDFVKNLKLSDHDCRLLVKSFQNGDNKTLEKLIQGFSPMIINFIPFNKRNSVNAEDDFQNGVIGLINAARCYDCSSETKFSTYAYLSIKRTIQRYKLNNDFEFSDFLNFDSYVDDIADGVIKSIDYRLLSSELIKLPEKNFDIIEKHFGFQSEPMTFHDIGSDYGVSRQAIQSKLKKDLNKLKDNVNIKYLAKEYL